MTLEDVNHPRIKAKHPQANGICEWFRSTRQDKFYAIAFRKKNYQSLHQLQVDQEAWIYEYNTNRTHNSKYCYGRTPMQTFLESLPLAKEKNAG